MNGKDRLRVLHSSIPSIVEDLRNIITAGWEGEIVSEVGMSCIILYNSWHEGSYISYISMYIIYSGLIYVLYYLPNIPYRQAVRLLNCRDYQKLYVKYAEVGRLLD